MATWRVDSLSDSDADEALAASLQASANQVAMKRHAAAPHSDALLPVPSPLATKRSQARRHTVLLS